MKIKKEDILGISVKKEDDIAEWYSQVCQKAELADSSSVSGFMVIRPRAYNVWERIRDYFDSRLRQLKIPNAYFPLLIPEKFFKREAEHAEGFAPELAWVQRKDSEERLAIRPTSETIIYDSFSKWIRSYKDLPFKINQWCNVLRWEVSSVKLFLRTREFLWQEGHCAYESEQDCDNEVSAILKEYKDLCEDLLAIPVIAGKKTEKEKFAGAKYTMTIEAFMPDGKALQCGTSHNLGKSFSKAFGISYTGEDEKIHTPYLSSWGFSTRLIGAMIMTHGDDRGLIIPPRVAPVQVVIVPILFDKSKEEVLRKCNEIRDRLVDFRVEIDDREDYNPGWKFNEHELKGVPLRIEIGPRDIDTKKLVLVRRDSNTKKLIKDSDVVKEVDALLDTIQRSLFANARRFLEGSIVEVGNFEDLVKEVKKGRIALADFCGSSECEDSIKAESGGVSARVIHSEDNKGSCVRCKKKGKMKVYFSRSY